LNISHNNTVCVVRPYRFTRDVIFKTIKASLPYSFAPLESAQDPAARDSKKGAEKYRCKIVVLLDAINCVAMLAVSPRDFRRKINGGFAKGKETWRDTRNRRLLVLLKLELRVSLRHR